MPLVEQELLTLPDNQNSSPVYRGVHVTRNLVFMCMCCRSLYVLLSFFFWQSCCLFFFDLRFLNTPLVSSNSYYKTSTKQGNQSLSNKHNTQINAINGITISIRTQIILNNRRAIFNRIRFHRILCISIKS